jgi:hypothetical protein
MPAGSAGATTWPSAPETRIDLLLVIAAFIGISAWACGTQRPERLYADGQKYQSMSRQFFESHVPVSVDPPFVYRIGTPWLASAMFPATRRWLPRLDSWAEDRVGMIGVAPFYLVNVAAAGAAAVLLLLYLRCFVASARVRALLVIAWIGAWHAPARFVYFYPVNVDALFLAMLFAALVIVERFRQRAPLAAALAVAPMVFAGTLVRESMVLAAVAFAAAQGLADSRRVALSERILAAVVPLAAWALALLAVRRIAAPAHPYHPWAEALSVIHEKPLFTWVLAWFFTFGPPAIALIAAASREVWKFLRTRPDLGVYLAVCGAVAFAAGSDTERILEWATPAVCVLVGQAIAARRAVLARLPALIAILAAVQIASSRLLWPIPVGVDHAQRFSEFTIGWTSLAALADKFLVIHNYYSNLWSFFGSAAVHAAILAFDVVFAAAVAFHIERMSRRRAVGRRPQRRTAGATTSYT